MDPVKDSVLVLTTATRLVAASKTSKVARVGDNTISPGELPALIEDARAGVSFSPLMMTRPANAVGLDTPCDARTRVVSWLGGLVTYVAL
jgi:hypothetical protein